MHFGCGYTGAKSLQWDQILYLNMFFIVSFSYFIFLHQITQRWVVKHAFFHSLLVWKIFVATNWENYKEYDIFIFTLIPSHSLETFQVLKILVHHKYLLLNKHMTVLLMMADLSNMFFTYQNRDSCFVIPLWSWFPK